MTRTDRPAATPTSETWTTRRLLRWMVDFFEQKSIDAPRVVAELLLGHVLGCERMRLYMESDRPASRAELAALRALVARAGRHEPAQYLVGSWWFYSRPFKVDPCTLIPRPCTETLVGEVIRRLREEPGHATPLLADLGTGTGCIAVTLALECPTATVIATDIVAASLDLARTNATTHGVVDRIDFLGGSVYDAFDARPGLGDFDAICANLPYIPDHEWADVAPNVRDHEPATALRAGADGLDFIRPAIADAGRWLRPGGWLALEIASSHRDAAMALARANAALTDALIVPDHENLPRVLIARRR